MNILNSIPLARLRRLWRGQQGITGLETAIVLIAFVVVSSVFAFAVLSTGLFTTDKAKQTINAGLSESRSTLELRGSLLVDATAAGTAGVAEEISFQVANAAAGEPIDLSAGNTIIKYSDTTQSINLTTSSQFSVTDLNGNSDSLLEPGEVFEIKLLDLEGATLTNDLGVDTQFTIEVIPSRGAVLFIQRKTPVSFSLITSLD